MTVSSTSSDTRYSGNGSTTAFATGFTFYASSTLRVSLIQVSTGVETVQTLTTHYTVSGGNGSTGTVTMLTAPASGYTLVIKRDEPYTQLTDLLDNDPLPAPVLEGTYDKLVMQIQQVYRRTLTAIQAPATFNPNTDTPYTMSAPTNGTVPVGNGTGWDATALASVSTATVPVAIVSLQNRDVLEYDSGATVWRNQTLNTVLKRIATSAGDLLYNLGGTMSRLAIGSAGTTLISDGSAPAWEAVPWPTPGGRLTLQTGEPVMAANYTSKTTLYYTPYLHNSIPVYNGSRFVVRTFEELSVATTDTTKNPAAIGASKVNDWFVWYDAGTMRLSHGPDWTSDTARSAGTALTRVNGVLVNNVAITNGPGANQGTYVGTTRSDASSQLNWHTGGAATGGTEAFLNVWNAYNRRVVKGYVQDTTASWTYNSSTVRQARAQSTMKVNYVVGFAEDFFEADYTCSWQGDLGVFGTTGVGIDSTTTMSGRPGRQIMLNTAGVTNAPGQAVSQAIGAHYMAALEVGNVSFTITFFCGPSGSNGPGQGGLSYNGWF